jgi:SAM-dependent methyltransferase
MAKYNHTVEMHNLEAPRAIVPHVLEYLNPKSVVDVGCGLGTFLRIFKENGVSDLLGIDGAWCKKELLFRNIKPSEFLEVDMENPIRVERRFDLAVCLEVAEHLSESRGKSFVEDLCGLSDVVLFSAAIPKQGGDHHLNEQWLGYWESFFNSHGYKKYDVFKSLLWDNPNVFWWYKQNMVLFVRKPILHPKLDSLIQNPIGNVIHPELFLTVSDYRDRNAIKRYTRGLIKAVGHKLGLVK